MNQLLSQKEIDDLKNINGEIKGTGIIENLDFVIKHEGIKAMERLEEAMKDLGYPFKYKEIKPMKFYPLWWDGLLLTVIQQLFNYSEDKFEEMGVYEPKISFILKLFTKYFSSSKVIINQAPKMWRSYYTIGDLKVIDFNEEKKFAILRLENFHYVPASCSLYKGFFSSVIQILFGGKAKAKETKCIHKGDDFHEFFVEWE